MEYYLVVILLHGLLAQAYEIDHLPEHRIRKRATDYVGGIDYIGIGYNLLYGNPDGSPTTAALDPGLRPTWRIFDWTFVNGNSEPDQIIYIPSAGCSEVKNIELYHNEYAYAEKFDLDVSLSGSSTFVFGETKFSQSIYYSEASDSFGSSSYVFYEDEKYCIMGQARLQTELAKADRYPLSRSFVQRVNDLPDSYSMFNSDYMKLLDDFGTHVVSEVLLGTKVVDRYYWTTSEFTSYTSEYYSSSTSLGGSYLGYSGSLEVDIDSVEENFNEETSSATHSETFSLGDDDLSLPYAYTLMSIDEIFDAKFWTLYEEYEDDGILSSDFYNRIATMKENVKDALGDYADWLNSISAIKDSSVIVPLTWPVGAFGLPQTKTGCPTTSGFTFHTGYRYHDTEDDDNNDYWSSNHFPDGTTGGNLRQYFCMKTADEVTQWDGSWPSGQYCVFQPSSRNCPTGMEEGYIKWDDEDDDNANKYSGSVPGGSYGRDTIIYYCCKDDGFSENPIYLPTDSPFYLFPHDHTCQDVEGMDVTMEYIRWDNEDDDNADKVSGEYPYKNSGSNHKIYYCYYY